MGWKSALLFCAGRVYYICIWKFCLSRIEKYEGEHKRNEPWNGGNGMNSLYNRSTQVEGGFLFWGLGFSRYQ